MGMSVVSIAVPMSLCIPSLCGITHLFFKMLNLCFNMSIHPTTLHRALQLWDAPTLFGPAHMARAHSVTLQFCTHTEFVTEEK